MPVRRNDASTIREVFKRAGPAEKIALIISLWFGAGLAPRAKGTFGTLAAVAPVAAIKYLGAASECIFIIVLVSIALWSSHVARNCLERDDPSEVVIDEAAGFCLSVFLLPFTWIGLCLGFLLFRFFDILKPFPIGMIDRRVKGGAGIVLDDIVAGIFANIAARIFLIFIGL